MLFDVSWTTLNINQRQDHAALCAVPCYDRTIEAMR
jgi:hypothetical protein